MNDNRRHAMDERWLKALRAKNISVKGMHNGKSHALGEQTTVGKATVRSASQPSKRHAQPFKATGHKGGISQQGA